MSTNYLPPDVPPGGAPLPPGQPTQRRSGCRTCLTGCLVTLAVLAVIAVVFVGAVVYVLRQQYPRAASMQESATCVILGFALNNAEKGLQQSDASASDKAQIQQGVNELRSQYDQKCAALR